MLVLTDKKKYDKNELYYYNLIEKGELTTEELKDINLIYFYNYRRAIISIETDLSLDIVKDLCSTYLNVMCNYFIERGTNVTLSDGRTYHFSLTLEDQQNLTNAFNIATFRNSSVPYHADGEECRIFSQEDIKMIYETCIMYITQQTTYCNMLKQYIKSCTSKEDVIEAYYSMELSEEYKAKYDEIISHSLEVINI